uniref:Uncharacterized protein n=1 Tax=Musca domestica TaxID=7370 RepID=A0A1I8MD06_MUSDO
MVQNKNQKFSNVHESPRLQRKSQFTVNVSQQRSPRTVVPNDGLNGLKSQTIMPVEGPRALTVSTTGEKHYEPLSKYKSERETNTGERQERMNSKDKPIGGFMKQKKAKLLCRYFYRMTQPKCTPYRILGTSKESGNRTYADKQTNTGSTLSKYIYAPYMTENPRKHFEPTLIPQRIPNNLLVTRKQKPYAKYYAGKNKIYINILYHFIVSHLSFPQ